MKGVHRRLLSEDHARSGFTLLEVMITMTILLTLVVAIAAMLRSAIDVKQALARESRVTHRLSLAMSRITFDIEHAFITGLNDEARGGANRRFKTIFKVDKTGESDKLFLSMMGRKQSKKGAAAGDAAYVVYEIRDSKDIPGRKHLFRGISPLTLEDLKTDPEMKLFVRNIKSFRVISWRGDDWSNDRWDSSRGEWRDKLPQMVRVELETWGEDDNEVTADSSAEQRNDENIVSVKTIVRLQQARFMKEVKQPATSMRLY
jgi:prepilin-type N-terminal cleavage/methylation domain-containing protein